MISHLKTVLRRNAFLFRISRSVAYSLSRLYGITIGKLVRPFKVKAYLDRNEIRKLHIGCGDNYLDGWLNTDGFQRSPKAVYMDATAAFPLQENAWDYVFSEHMIEHIHLIDAYTMLEEAFRCLKPGGIIRIATPDLDNLVKLLDPLNKDKVALEYIDHLGSSCLPTFDFNSRGIAFNLTLREWGHLFIFDFDTMKGILEKAGFTNVVRREVFKSDHDALSNLEKHGDAIGSEEFNLLETMIVEAVKP